MIKKCLGCQCEFSSRPHENRLYCSLACYWQYKKEQNKHECFYCKKIYYRSLAHQSRVDRGFCSHKCFGKCDHGADNPAWRGGLVELVCLECGTSFRVKQIQARRGAKYCSQKCQNEVYRRNPPNGKPKVAVPCQRCGRVTELSPSQASKRKFCSMECKNKAHAKKMLGDGNGRYVHGECAKPYATSFPRSLRELIRNRDNRQCRLCNMDELQNGKKMDIHHINYEKLDNREENLISLCRFCHGSLHGGEAQRLKWKEELSSLLKEQVYPNLSITSLPKIETTLQKEP